jgi:hypothetical protein
MLITKSKDTEIFNADQIIQKSNFLSDLKYDSNKQMHQIRKTYESDGGGVSQTMYTHVSKCKNDKMK